MQSWILISLSRNSKSYGVWILSVKHLEIFKTGVVNSRRDFYKSPLLRFVGRVRLLPESRELLMGALIYVLSKS